MSTRHEGREQEFAEVKARVEAATTIEEVKAAVLEFMDIYRCHNHPYEGEADDFGRREDRSTDSPMGD